MTARRRRRGQPSKLTPQRQAAIVNACRAGATGMVAAEAAGISRSSFYAWLARGQAALDALTDDQADQELAGQLAHVDRLDRPWARFAAAVTQAQAQARLYAEMRVYRERPDLWLLYGPGRDHPDAPGWTRRRVIASPDAPGWTRRRVIATPDHQPTPAPVILRVVDDWADELETSPNGDILPTTEGQARPLTALPPELRADAWQDATA
jgi:AcrR family transcriptional regulator